jgi:hypothetical protein
MSTARTYPYPTPVTILAWATIHGAAEDREASGRELARIILEEGATRQAVPSLRILPRPNDWEATG